MSLTIPASVNYPSPLFANASRMQDEPKNGRQQISIELDWGSMGGPANCVSINVQGNRVNNFEQIASLKVDNSQSGADVVFIWPDVTDTMTIPAGTPYAVVPVLSNALQFYAVAAKGLLGDVTRIQLLNYPVPPSDIPVTVESQTASSGGTVITGGAGGPIQLVAAGINGTLETLKLVASQNVAGAWQTAVTVRDGAATPNVFLNSWNFAQAAGATNPVFTLLDFDAANWRFVNGLQVLFTPLGGAGSFIANAFADYRQP